MQMSECKKDRKQTVVRCAKAAAFAILALFMIHGLTRLLTPKWIGIWNACKIDTQFYREQKNSMDVIFMGSSCGSSSIDPVQLFDETGIMSYDLCNNSQPLLSTYFWVKEVLKTQSPKMIILEVVSIGMETAKEELKARRSYEYMKWSKNKLDYANAYVAAGDGNYGLISYLFPLYLYHSRWSSLTVDDFAFVAGDDGTLMRGFTPNRTTLAEAIPDFEYTGLDETEEEELELLPSNTEYLQKIIDLCKENEIELMLMKTCDSKWMTSSHEYISQVAEENDLLFLDMNLPEIVEETGIVMREDAMDTRHLNLRGAQKTTEYLGKYLREHTDLPDRRGEERYEKIIGASREYHDCLLEDLMLCFSDSFCDYAGRLAETPRYVVLAALSGTEGTITAEEKEVLRTFGLEENFLEKPVIPETRMLIKASTADRSAAAKRGGKDLAEEGTLPTGEIYEMSASGSGISILIDGKEYASDSTGISVVIYDTVLQTVSDQFALSFGKDGTGLTLKRG